MAQRKSSRPPPMPGSEETVGQSRRDVLLGQSGWQKSTLNTNDKRLVLDLTPVMTLQEVRKILSNRKHADEDSGLLRNGWTNKEYAAKVAEQEYEARQAKRLERSGSRNLRAAVMKQRAGEGVVEGSAGWDSAAEELDHNFVQQVARDAKFGPAAAEARNVLGREKPHLLQKIAAQTDKEAQRSEKRRFQLNAKGVFEKEVNVVRNRNMHRVDLRRGLTDAALTKEEPVLPIDPFKIPNSLEARMQDLLNVVCLIVDGPETAPNFDTSLAGAAVSMALMHRQNRAAPLLASRMEEVESVTSEMLGRYRKRVREEQLKLLQEMGLDPNAPATWDQAVEVASGEQTQSLETAATENAAELKSRNTEELMEAVLARLNQIEDRMAQQEAQAAEAEGRQDTVEPSLASSYASSVRGDVTPQRLDTEPSTCRSDEIQIPSGRQQLDDGVRPRTLPDYIASSLTQSSPPPVFKPPPKSEPSTRSLFSPSRRSIAVPEDFYIPDEDELDAAPLPRLPALTQLPGMTEADTLQARLERTWGLLEMPMMGKLDMVIKYTSREVSSELEEALEMWETAAACVVERERLLGVMVEMQERMDSGDILRPLFTSQHITEVAMDFMAATHHCRRFDAALRQRFDDKLNYQGMEYPGEDAVTDEQLSAFVHRAMQVAAVLIGSTH